MSNNPLVKKMLHGQMARPADSDFEDINIPPPRVTWSEFREPNQGFNYTIEDERLGKTLLVGESFTPQGDRRYTDTTAIMEEVLIGLSDVNAIIRSYEIGNERLRLARQLDERGLQGWRGFRDEIAQAAEDTVNVISGNYSYRGPAIDLGDGRGRGGRIGAVGAGDGGRRGAMSE